MSSSERRQRFQELQARLPELWRKLSKNPRHPRTIVAIPSLSLDFEGMAQPEGLVYYEERMFYLFNLLRNPNTRLVLVTSHLVPEALVSYHLHLLPSVPYSHARERVSLLTAFDLSNRPLADKLLARPALMERLRRAIGPVEHAYMVCYTTSHREVDLALQLNVPLHGVDPEHHAIGTKAGSRRLFRHVGVPCPDGVEELSDEKDIAAAVVELRQRHPHLTRVVIKQNEAISGLGNAVFHVNEAESPEQVLARLASDARLQSPELQWEEFAARFRRLGGVVEEYLEGTPCSVQLRITPLGDSQVVSTHDELRGGSDDHTYVGCRFPAYPDYLHQLHDAGRRIGEHLAQAGVIGRVDADFLATDHEDGVVLQGIDINLRRGNTTLPIRTLQLLAGGTYDTSAGVFRAQTGEPRYYVSSDKFGSRSYRGLLPEDLIDMATYSGIHYTSSDHTGTVFHMLGGLSELGMVGATCIAKSPREAELLYKRARRVLDRDAAGYDWMI